MTKTETEIRLPLIFCEKPPYPAYSQQLSGLFQLFGIIWKTRGILFLGNPEGNGRLDPLRASSFRQERNGGRACREK